MNLITLMQKLRPYVRPYRWMVVATLLLTLAGSFIAQVNAIVLDRTVDAINALLVPEGFDWNRAAHILTVISVVLLGKELVAAVIRYAQNYCGERMRILVSKDLSQAVVDRILSYRMTFFTRPGNETGRLQTRIDQGVGSLSATVQSVFIDLLPLFTSALLALVLMFAANVYVGLTALFIVPIYICITIYQARRLKGWRANMRHFRETKSSGMVGIIESMSVIKSFNRQQVEGSKQWNIQTQFTDNQMLVRKTSFRFDGAKSLVQQVGTVLIIILTAYLVLTGYPGMSIGKIMYHVMLFANVTAPITQLQRIFDSLNDALIYAEGFFDILDADDEREPSGSYRPAQVKGNFELRDVCFSYPGQAAQQPGKEPARALNHVSMTIGSGRITALVGLSGAGKSTVVNLLERFYEPDSGDILLDGVSLSQWDTAYLRDHIGLVLQKNHIFEGTVEENIRYGKPNATDEEVADAARKAFIYDQLMAKPEGMKTQATALSGGQQQRIAIARMFLKNPPIIFLDEPTASLDAVATEQIKASIDAIKRDRTVIIISHSISQIIDSDMVYAMQEGRVEQSGQPDELYRKGGVYKDIVDASARSLNIDKLSQTLRVKSS